MEEICPVKLLHIKISCALLGSFEEDQLHWNPAVVRQGYNRVGGDPPG